MTQHPQRRPDVEVTTAADGFLARVPGTDALTWLNRTGYLVLELCTGVNDVATIAAAMRHAFDLNSEPVAAVRETIAELVTAGLVIPGATERHPEAAVEIALWVPTEAIATDVMVQVQGLLDDLAQAGVTATLTLDTDRSLRGARNQAANRALRATGTTHVLFLDATAAALAAARECDLPRLTLSNHEVIGIPIAVGPVLWDRARAAAIASPNLSHRDLAAYARAYDVSFTTMPTVDDIATGFIEGHHCNSGALLVQRTALERIAGSNTANRQRGVLSHAALTMGDGWGFFDSGFSQEAIDLDEDFAFAERLRAAGGRLMITLNGDFGRSVLVGRLVPARPE